MPSVVYLRLFIVTPWRTIRTSVVTPCHPSDAYLSTVLFQRQFTLIRNSCVLFSLFPSPSVSIFPPYELFFRASFFVCWPQKVRLCNVFHVMLLLQVCFTLPSIPKQLGVTLRHFSVGLVVPVLQIRPLAPRALLVLMPHTACGQIC